MAFDRENYDSLMRQHDLIGDRIRQVCDGVSTGFYLYGRPGTSKTHTVKSTLKDLAAPHEWHSGHLTPIGLYELIEENRDRTIVLDDVSSIFGQPIALQILLAATSPLHDGAEARIVRYKKAQDDRSVPFRGGIIAISNLALGGHHAQILAALRSRMYALNYEPTDEQMLALIYKIADEGIGGLPPKDCREVALYLRKECIRREIRPSVRLFVSKAIPDYRSWKTGKTERHWRDHVASELEQQDVEIQHPQRALTRAERTEAERRLALDIAQNCTNRQERLERWISGTTNQFGHAKSEKALYRRLAELKGSGRAFGLVS
jgi:hypothetical protein